VIPNRDILDSGCRLFAGVRVDQKPRRYWRLLFLSTFAGRYVMRITIFLSHPLRHLSHLKNLRSSARCVPLDFIPLLPPSSCSELAAPNSSPRSPESLQRHLNPLLTFL